MSYLCPDPELVGEVAVLREIAAEGDMTMIIVTHEMDFAREVADRILSSTAASLSKRGRPRPSSIIPATKEPGNF